MVGQRGRGSLVHQCDASTLLTSHPLSQALIEAQSKHGNSWSAIAKIIEGRSENSIKNRWNSQGMASLKKSRAIQMVPTASSSLSSSELVHRPKRTKHETIVPPRTVSSDNSVGDGLSPAASESSFSTSSTIGNNAADFLSLFDDDAGNRTVATDDHVPRPYIDQDKRLGSDDIGHDYQVPMLLPMHKLAMLPPKVIQQSHHVIADPYQSHAGLSINDQVTVLQYENERLQVEICALMAQEAAVNVSALPPGSKP